MDRILEGPELEGPSRARHPPARAGPGLARRPTFQIDPFPLQYLPLRRTWISFWEPRVFVSYINFFWLVYLC